MFPRVADGRLVWCDAQVRSTCRHDTGETPSLEHAGIEFAGDRFDTGVCHMAFFSDPDGHALMLHRRYAPRAPES
jgi:hypothetical protein